MQAKLQLFQEHRKKVNVYRIGPDDEDNIVQQKSTKNKIKTLKKDARQVSAGKVMPTIRKRFAKKQQQPQPPPPVTLPEAHTIDTEKVILGCVCIGLGLYLIYLTRQGSLEAKEIISDA